MTETTAAPQHDAVLWGATGYVGQILAGHLAAQHAAGTSAGRWALAGRDRDRLARVRDDAGLPADTPLLVADADDAPSVEALVRGTRLVLSVVGPYGRHGSALVAACAAHGVDYVDLSGEPRWARRMIAEHGPTARSTGARLVLSAGFDSVPFELAAQVLQREAHARWGSPLPALSCRVLVEGDAGFSGGTLASLAAEVEAARADGDAPGLVLPSGYAGSQGPLSAEPAHDDALGMWVAPWVLAPINVWNLHWSNALRGHAWGDLTYDEMMLAGPGPVGEATATAIAGMMAGLVDAPPRLPGEGPDAAARDAGAYTVLLTGSAPDGRRLTSVVTAQGDPGYGSTSRIVLEVARGLLVGAAAPGAGGGFWTPGALLGEWLEDRLAAHAGLTFTTQGAADRHVV
ncbi:trans-acting enoyl reductase family protein [Cellulomonas cellasea]|uniref:Short subunit dehydrogenase-like uncharacterized protein n=1 Tax=Cellulomonas cellasea TaxID=43670 RepID=A0A7W4YCQ8_9CELL|nr:saccharopine dehydrogenase NADP-binding domain-containing protein [Cellulomonas cellasea]MBB2925270.1 short subunit dehydrogenase-like uncharacterized protein [Cellulomonas cellasea]